MPGRRHSKTLCKDNPLTPDEQRMVEDNVRLAYFMVIRFKIYYGQAVCEKIEEDMPSVAFLALMRSVRFYDKERSAFSTYASHAIWRELIKLKNEAFTQPWTNYVAYGPGCQRHGDLAYIDDSEGAFDLPEPEPDRTPLGYDELQRLANAVGRLFKREAEILRLRFWEGQTLEEIGQRYGCSKERIRQLTNRALARLRRELQGAA